MKKVNRMNRNRAWTSVLAVLAVLAVSVLGVVGLVFLKSYHAHTLFIYLYGELAGAAQLWVLIDADFSKPHKSGERGTRLNKQDEESRHSNPVCLDCGGTEFLEGPSAGVITNIKCAAKGCGSEYRYRFRSDGTSH